MSISKKKKTQKKPKKKPRTIFKQEITFAFVVICSSDYDNYFVQVVSAIQNNVCVDKKTKKKSDSS